MGSSDSRINQARLAALALAADPNFRVLSRFERQSVYGMAAPGEALFRAAVVDTETTGLDVASDLLIEIAIIPFTFTADGEVMEVLESEVYVGLQDPGAPLSETIQRVTGLRDADLAGQQFDIPRIEALVRSCRLLVAHNASFDRRMLERLSKVFRSIPWACSSSQLPWDTEGVGSRKLDYIAGCLGFFYDAHRAEADARALLHILSKPLPASGQLPLAVMREALRAPHYSIWVTGRTYDVRGKLRDAGYRWVDEPGARFKGNHKLVRADQADIEIARAEEIATAVGGDARVNILPLNPLDLFTARV